MKEKQTQRSRQVQAATAGAIFAGMCALFLNFYNSGYFFFASRIQLEPDGIPQSLTAYLLEPQLNIRSVDERNLAVNRCSLRASCMSARSWLRDEQRADWIATPMFGRADVERALARAFALSPAPFFREGVRGAGVIGSYKSHDMLFHVLTFNSYELGDDWYGYLEIKFSSDLGSVVESAFYYHEVAGLEFITPAMRIVGAALLGAAVGFFVLGRRGVS